MKEVKGARANPDLSRGTRQPATSPYMLVLAALALASGIFGLNKINPLFMPILLGISCLGMGLVIWAEWRGHRRVAKDQESESIRLSKIDIKGFEPWLKQNIRGQDETVEAVIADLQRSLLLARPGRILGAYLLVGPTGTGKTFLGQLIAEALYPDSEPVILRMNQYKHHNDVLTLLGPPPGMPGYEIGGTLTRPVLENPSRVIILDEIEKAHPDLRHCLYDVLDTAACWEKSSGQLVDFSRSVFFGTCNGGTEALRAARVPNADRSVWLGRARNALRDSCGFDPAFLARWTDIFLMDELAPLNVAEIACLELQRYWRDYGIEVSYIAPELILAAVEGNEEFRSYGVRQLGAFIKAQTTDGIAQARASGFVRVNLTVNDRGALTVVPVSGTLHSA
jgi:ATP-dependent Clp protease ATP-binding subunit ClpA